MSRMLQALRQIEAKTERWPQPAVSAAAAHAVALQSAPTTNVVEAAQEAFDRVEAALAAENLGPPDSLAALQIEPLPGLDALAAPTSAADPYAALANSIVSRNGLRPAATSRGPTGSASAVLLFTSPGDGEGKSTTLARLAPELQRRSLGRSPCGRREPSAAAPAACPSIHLTGRPIEALAGLRKRCRFVLVDAPSLRFSETAPLTACCDGTYLFVQLGATTRRGLTEAVAAIQRNQGRLAGCIVVD